MRQKYKTDKKNEHNTTARSLLSGLWLASSLSLASPISLSTSLSLYSLNFLLSSALNSSFIFCKRALWMTSLFTLLILICRAFLSLAVLNIAPHNTQNHRNTPQDLKREAQEEGRRDENLKIKENQKPLISLFGLEFCMVLVSHLKRIVHDKPTFIKIKS